MDGFLARCMQWFLLACLTLVVYPAAAQITAGDLILVDSKRVGRTAFEYTYQVNATNTGPAVQNVTATVISTSLNTVIVEGGLSFGDLSADSTVASTDTFTLRQDRRFFFDPANLIFSFSASAVDPGATVAFIGPGGGTLETPDGAKIVIPPGALNQERLISLSNLPTALNLPVAIGDTWAPYLGGISLGPDGLQLNEPVTVTIPIGSAEAAGQNLPLLLFREDLEAWEQTDFLAQVDATGSFASASITHFSILVIQISPLDSAPLFPPILLTDTWEEIGAKVMARFLQIYPPGSREILDFSVIPYNCYTPIAIDVNVFHSDVELDGEQPIFLISGDPASVELKLLYFRPFDRLGQVGGQPLQVVADVIVTVYLDSAVPDFSLEARDAGIWVTDNTEVTASVLCDGEGMRFQGVDLATLVGLGELADTSGFTNQEEGQFTTEYRANDTFGGTENVRAEYNWSNIDGSQTENLMADAQFDVYSLTGTWSGSGTETVTGCEDDEDNGTFSDSATFFLQQNGFALSTVVTGANVQGTVLFPAPNGGFNLMGTFSGAEEGTAFVGMFNGLGRVSGSTGTFNVNWNGADIGDTCVFSGSGSATRD